MISITVCWCCVVRAYVLLVESGACSDNCHRLFSMRLADVSDNHAKLVFDVCKAGWC